MALVIGLFLGGPGMHAASALDRSAGLAGIEADAAVPGTEAPRAVAVDFQRESASAAARETVAWILDAGDNDGLPFILVDKIDGKVFLFDRHGGLRGAASALLGLAPGDESVPGIGERRLSEIRPEERTTPAGRFVAALGRNLQGSEILWIDYDAAISLHAVITGNAKERRVQRLESPSPSDNRISYGCINVPARFFDQLVRPAFHATPGIVYILPETRAAQARLGWRVATPIAP